MYKVFVCLAVTLILGVAGCGDSSSSSSTPGPSPSAQDIPDDSTPDTTTDPDAEQDVSMDVDDGSAADMGDDTAEDTVEDMTMDTAMDTTMDDATDTQDDMMELPGGGGGRILIYLAGDQQSKTFNDGLAGQTPTNYEIALSGYQVMTASDDPNPQPCFDHGDAPVVANLAGDTLMGSCPTSMIATAQYTHGRVRVDWLRYQVSGTLHAAGQVLPGQFTFFRAYSAVTFEGQSYQPGEGYLRYAGATTFERPMTFTDTLAWPGVTTELVNGEYWMTFPYGRPLPVVQNSMDEYWARFHWEIFEAFRWQNMSATGFMDGVWDVVPPPGASEQVQMSGVSGFYITTSLD